MKKVVIVVAFVMFAAITYAAYVSVNTNSVVIEKVDKKPKDNDEKAETKSVDKQDDVTKSEKKSECTKKKTSSCEKSCSGK